MKFKLLPITLSLVLAVSCHLSSALAQGENYLFALRALEDGHLEAAILAFETFLQEQPKDPRRAEARFFLAEAKLEKGLSAEALRDYRAFLKEFPKHGLSSRAHFRVGTLELDNKRYKAASTHFSAVEKGPLADQALYYLGHIRFRLGDWKGTIKALSGLLRHYPKSPWVVDSRYALGMAGYREGDDEGALRNLAEYLKTAQPGPEESLWANSVLGEIRKRRGDCRTAKANFTVVLQGAPRFSGREAARWGVAECHYEEKEFDAAAKQYVQYLKDYPRSANTVAAYIRGGHSQLLSGQYSAAAEMFRVLEDKKIPPDYRKWVLYWRARAEDLSGQKEAALQSYERLIDAYPKTEQALNAAAEAAAMRFEKKEYEKALKHLDTLKGSPDPVQADWATQMAGNARFALGRYKEAFEVFQTVLPKVREPKAREGMIWKLAVSAYQTKQDKEALRYLDFWLKSNPEDGDENRSTQRVDALKMLASVQTRLGLLRELVDTLGKLETALPTRPDASTSNSEHAALSANQGLVLFRLKDYAAAEERFRYWLTRYPDAKNRPEVLLHLGLAELRLGKNTDAAHHLDSFVNEFGSHPQAQEALYASALGYLRGREYAKSTERLEKWLAGAKAEKSPERVKEAWFLLAATHEKAENWKEAASSYHRIMRLYPQESKKKPVFYRLTALYDRLSRQAESEQTLRWLEERYPDRKLRGRIFLQLGKEHLQRKEWNQAIHYLRDAVRSPEEFVKGEGYYRLASIYIHRGKHRQALEAIANVPVAIHDQADWKAEADYIQGVAYEGEKDWENAIRSYRVAARSAMTAPVARAALDRISQLEFRRWKK